MWGEPHAPGPLQPAHPSNALNASAGAGGASAGGASQRIDDASGSDRWQSAGQPPYQILYMDTEGFESTGHSNTYDDRIFALSSVMASLLVYNLPEAIRESDVAKLSFAVELAQGFFRRMPPSAAAAGNGVAGHRDAPDRDGAGSQDGAVAPPVTGGGLAVDAGNMLWLLQRDFLQVRALRETVLLSRLILKR